jgi:hypothetical protein
MAPGTPVALPASQGCPVVATPSSSTHRALVAVEVQLIVLCGCVAPLQAAAAARGGPLLLGGECRRARGLHRAVAVHRDSQHPAGGGRLVGEDGRRCARRLTTKLVSAEAMAAGVWSEAMGSCVQGVDCGRAERSEAGRCLMVVPDGAAAATAALRPCHAIDGQLDSFNPIRLPSIAWQAARAGHTRHLWRPPTWLPSPTAGLPSCCGLPDTLGAACLQLPGRQDQHRGAAVVVRRRRHSYRRRQHRGGSGSGGTPSSCAAAPAAGQNPQPPRQRDLLPRSKLCFLTWMEC